MHFFQNQLLLVRNVYGYARRLEDTLGILETKSITIPHKFPFPMAMNRTSIITGT